MSELKIPCPRCGKGLKLPDRSLLGRKGKCPKCKHTFVLAEPDSGAAATSEAESNEAPPDMDELYDELDQIEQRRQANADEVEFEIADSPAPLQSGTGARWVPDAAAPPAAVGTSTPAAIPPAYPYPVPGPVPTVPPGWAAPPGYSVVPYPSQPGMPYVMPPGYVPVPYGSPGYPPMSVPSAAHPATPPYVAPAPVAPAFPPAASVPTAPVANNPFAAIAEQEAVPSALPSRSEMQVESSSFRTHKKKNKRQRNAKQTQLVAIVAAGMLVVGGIAFMTVGGGSRAKTDPKSPNVVKNSASHGPAPVEPPKWESPLPVSPTKGAPISLICMPYGVAAIVHLRPAELWEKGTKREEFRYCWGPLGTWLESRIQAICNREPAQIEELTFGLVPGIVGEPFQVCGVVRLKQALQKTELIAIFRKLQAELRNGDDSDYPLYVSQDYAYMIKDLQTFAFCPATKQSEMAEAINRPNAQAPGLEALIAKTDRQRHLVVMFDPAVLMAHAQFVLPKELHPFANRVIEFFDPKQIETVAWSLHIGDEKFHSEILARNKTSVAKTTLQYDLKKRVDNLPRELADSIRGYMDPKQVGPRQIIGRFPAMTKVFALSTHAASGDRFASLTTALPERAAPNLAIGALLTWDESTRTDFTKAIGPTAVPAETGTKLPELVADRLGQLKCEIDFTKVPLQDGIKFIADECKVTIDIDGDALKAAGFTKNMEQNMKLGKVSGLEALAAILKKYEKERVPLVFVVDEAKKMGLLTTKEFAEKDNLKIFAMPPAPTPM